MWYRLRRENDGSIVCDAKQMKRPPKKGVAISQEIDNDKTVEYIAVEGRIVVCVTCCNARERRALRTRACHLFNVNEGKNR